MVVASNVSVERLETEILPWLFVLIVRFDVDDDAKDRGARDRNFVRQCGLRKKYVTSNYSDFAMDGNLLSYHGIPPLRPALSHNLKRLEPDDAYDSGAEAQQQVATVELRHPERPAERRHRQDQP